MKKKTQTISEELKMPRIYREDLESIESVITGDLKPQEYKIETNEYEYEKVEELPKDTRVTVDLHIQTYSPYISIDFNKHSARIYSGADDLKTVGAFKQIQSILAKRERKTLYYLSKISTWVAPILFVVPLQVLLKIGEINSSKHWITFGIAIVSASWWIVGFYSSLYRFSIINFNYSKDNPNFFVRNKDQIILVVIGAIMGAIATIILSKLSI